MPNAVKLDKGINRIIDANLNRAKEGMRVCEEFCRFILEDTPLTRRFKTLRHELLEISGKLAKTDSLLEGRDSKRDVGRLLHHKGELKRTGGADIFSANIQRLKESLRVLEEFGKLYGASRALGFKKLRYEAYALEKKTTERLRALRHTR